MIRLLVFAVLMVSGMLWPGLAWAQQGRDEARELEQLRDQATARQQDLEQQANQTQRQIAALQVRLIDLGGRIDKQNRISVETEEHLHLLQQDETIQFQNLVSDKKSMTEVLAALQRSEMSPPPPLAVSPDDMLAAARATLLLGETFPRLRARADDLRRSLEALATLRQEIATGQAQLKEQMQILTDEQGRLETLLGQRQVLETRLRGNARTASSQARSLAEQAQSVRELIQQLEAEARKTTPSLKPVQPGRQLVLVPSLKPDRNPGTQYAGTPSAPWHAPTGRFSDSRGQLTVPVEGVLLAGYGKASDPDRTSGMVFTTARRAQITAPYDARVAYSGHFRTYGQLLILDVGEGYHIILSGLASSYVVKDQTVLAGEPIGKMADRRKPAPVFYLEFRKQGQPFDPGPWLKKALKAG